MDNQTLLNQAVTFQKKGKVAEVITLCQEILKREPDNYLTLHLLGITIGSEHNVNQGIELIEAAIKLCDQIPAFYHNAAGLYRMVGNKGKSKHYLLKAIDLNPAYAESYQSYTELVKFNQDNCSILDKILSLLESCPSKASRRLLHFAAGKIYDDLKQYDKAFRHFKKANNLVESNFDVSGLQKQYRSLCAIYKDASAKKLDGGFASEQAVFVVGMPRSGTSLVEQIIASHPDAYGVGEIKDIWAISQTISKSFTPPLDYPAYLTELPEEAFVGYGKSYITKLNKLCGENKYKKIVNKNPLNFMYVGLILQLLPNAKFIHTLRSPEDTCLSCYFTNFTDGINFCSDLSVLGKMYNFHMDMMDFWKKVYPDNILIVNYENLIADQESVSREMIGFCSLDWSDQCLHFSEAKRQVRTASSWQVRENIYTSSLARHKPYKKYLSELLSTLN